MSLIVVCGLEFRERRRGPQERHSAAWKNTFFDGGARRMHGVVNTVFPLLDLDFGRAPTRMTATPPESFASRSCSFSQS